MAAYKDLPDKFSLASNLNLASVSDGKGRFFSSGETLWGARAIGAGVSLFAEAFRTTIDRARSSETVLDAGIFRGLGRHAQVDLAAGHTVWGPRPSWYATAGLVIRAPKALLGPGWYRSAFPRQ